MATGSISSADKLRTIDTISLVNGVTGTVIGYQAGKIVYLYISVTFPSGIAKWTICIQGVPEPNTATANFDITAFGAKATGLQLHWAGMLQTDVAGLGGTSFSANIVYMTN